MTEDPIVEEVRKAGQAYVDSFRGDWKALFEDLRRRTEEARQQGWRVVSMPPQLVAKPNLVPATRRS